MKRDLSTPLSSTPDYKHDIPEDPPWKAKRKLKKDKRKLKKAIRSSNRLIKDAERGKKGTRITVTHKKFE